MADIIDKFFQVYCSDPLNMRSIYTDKVSKEIMASSAEEGYYNWKLTLGTLTYEDYRLVEERFDAVFPDSFIEWHKRYHFAECDCSLLRLPNSLPSNPLRGITDNLNWDTAKELTFHGFTPFASEGNDTGPLVFDTRKKWGKGRKDFPIRVYEHEYCGDLVGLSDVIFSSFDKLLACITHFLNASNKKSFEIIPDFYTIDPKGAGSTGKRYWNTWANMLRANFEEFDVDSV